MDQFRSVKQRIYYTIGIDFVYRSSMVVAIRDSQDETAGGSSSLGVVGRVADGDHLPRLQAKIAAHLQQGQRVGLLSGQRIAAVHQFEIVGQARLRQQRLGERD